MKSNQRRLGLRSALIVLAALVAAELAGCAPKQESETPPASTNGPAAGVAGDHGGGGPAIVPGATSAEIWSQIRSQQLALETAIHEGRMSEIHDGALAVRDLAAALGERTAATAGPRRAAIEASIDTIRVAADRLHEYGDAGNLSGAEREFARLSASLASLAETTAP